MRHWAHPPHIFSLDTSVQVLTLLYTDQSWDNKTLVNFGCTAFTHFCIEFSFGEEVNSVLVAHNMGMGPKGAGRTNIYQTLIKHLTSLFLPAMAYPFEKLKMLITCSSSKHGYSTH